jgi:hypothetical protein
MLDRTATEAGLGQLPSGDHSVLARDDPCDQLVRMALTTSTMYVMANVIWIRHGASLAR